MTFQLTPEQTEILAAVKDSPTSLMVSALAGCGKTSTLTLIAQALPPSPSLALAFNVKIKKELESRFPSHFEIKTLNGLGHSAWGKAIGKRCEVDDRKIGKIINQLAKDEGITVAGDQWVDIKNLVTAAQQAGLVPSTYPHKSLRDDTQVTWGELAEDLGISAPSPLLLDFARAVLIESCKQAFQGLISYDDQIYMSAMFNGVFPRFPLVMVDEAQDLSPLNHIQVRKCAAGRLIVVGDPKQAIYAFRGADTESMAKLRALRPEWIDLTLSVTFRCPRRVVTRQQAHAPGFRAHESNHQGRVIDLPAKALPGEDDGDATWSWDEVSSALPGEPIAVLCRNNAPLVAMAFKLLRRGIGCHMLGRDLGRGLTAQAKKLLPQDDTPAEECVRIITDWSDSQQALAMANDRMDKAESIADQAECPIAILESGPCATAGELKQKITELFSKDSGLVTLATAHRAKGLEWPVVLHLDPWRVPSKWAQRAADAGDPRQLQQEHNLQYVLETRTQHTLILANLRSFA